MAEAESLASARILAEGILGRDRGQTHAGAYDGDLNANHVGKPLSNGRIMQLWQSAEAAAAANLREAHRNFYNTYNQTIEELKARPTVAEKDTLLQQLKDEQTKVVEAQKKLEEEQVKKTEDTQLLDDTRNIFQRIIDRIFKR